MFDLARRELNFDESLVRLETMAPRPRVALLLAGGDGMRLQELTRQITGAPIPKQFCRLLYGRSLLEATLFRTRHFATGERTRVVVNQDHLPLAHAQLRSLHPRNILVQPCNRDTGPGITFALQRIAQTDPDATVAVFPTDHYIDDDRVFMAHVLRAACLTSAFPEKIAILGIAPDEPETGYGYVVPAQPLRTSITPWRVFKVESFCEKPDIATAHRLIVAGGLWNTFVMVFKVAFMMQLLRELAPAGSAGLFDDTISQEELARMYRSLPPWNFSTEVLARIPEHLLVLEIDDVRWSDWGTRESVERTYQRLQLVPVWQREERPAALGVI